MLKLLAASGSAAQPLWVDDLFSATTYVGNGSTQTITNGIDLSGKGGLVWIKDRDRAFDHYLIDTVRGFDYNTASYFLNTNLTSAQAQNGNIGRSVSSTGFTVGIDGVVNSNTVKYASWTFRKATKFFDIQTFTSPASGSFVVNHSLGVVPGMVILKRTGEVDDWFVWHKDFASTNQYMKLNATAGVATSGGTAFFGTITSTDITLTVANWGASKAYVAYIFAHDTDTTNGLIQCGSFTTDGSGNATVNLGWEPQYVTIKCSSTTGPWVTADSARGFVATASNTAYLVPNTSAAEATATWQPNATGFTTTSALTNSSATYVYVAIRRSNKPPILGTQVYQAYQGASTTPDFISGWPVDMFICSNRGGSPNYILSRLQGSAPYLQTQSTAAEVATGGFGKFDAMNGCGDGSNWGTYFAWMFKRAVGVFDEVCYTGTGSTMSVTHGLGVVPEMFIVKRRTTAGAGWYVYHSALGATKYLQLESTAAQVTFNLWQDTTPTATQFFLANNGVVSGSPDTFVAYLFATKAGISKVGSYTGNGTSLTVDCGFSAGARFVLIKRTDDTGDWYVWDSVRGIIAGNDPHLSLNATAAEVTTDDTIDPDNSGFIVNQLAATNVNISTKSYIYLAFA